MRYTFRTNYIKSSDADIEKELSNNNIIYEKFFVLSALMFNVDEKYINTIKNLDIYINGYIYVQNPSSVLPALVLLDDDIIKDSINSKKNIDLLDMCAAPGGKSLALQSLSNNFFNITALERDKKRYERMKYNFELQGAKAYSKHISAYDIDDFLRFDVVILDAPCTGTDIINKNIDFAFLKKLVFTQKKLIDKAKKVLKKNGILIYSTCSILEEEDEKQVEYILKDRIFTNLYTKKYIMMDCMKGFLYPNL